MPPSTVMNESFFVDDVFRREEGVSLCFVFRFVPVAPGGQLSWCRRTRSSSRTSRTRLSALMNMTKVMSQDQLVLAGQRLRVAQGSPHGTFPSSPTSILSLHALEGGCRGPGRTVVPGTTATATATCET